MKLCGLALGMKRAEGVVSMKSRTSVINEASSKALLSRAGPERKAMDVAPQEVRVVVHATTAASADAVSTASPSMEEEQESTSEMLSVKEISSMTDMSDVRDPAAISWSRATPAQR